MTFSDILTDSLIREISDTINNANRNDVSRIIASREIGDADIPVLLSPAADAFLEEMAQSSRRITRERFGNTVQLYAPLYLSNECQNSCRYCGYNYQNSIKRITLTPEQIAAEAEILEGFGFSHILLLTGDHPRAFSVERLEATAGMLHNRFASLSIEVYPMSSADYVTLIDAGIDGLALYQETYDRATYETMHPSGKKRDYPWRLEGPDRGGEAGFRRIGIGTLMGLAPWRRDTAITILHARYLQRTYWKSQVQVSFPRIRQAPGEFMPPVTVTDRDLAHAIVASRLSLPDAGLILSTREGAELRDNLVALGITSMSAGSHTEPGGYGQDNCGTGQFTVVDTRTPEEIAALLGKKGFDAVWKDWDRAFTA